LLSKKGSKGWKLIKQKITNIKTLDNMRNDLLKQRANEIKEENNITDEITVSIFEENGDKSKNDIINIAKDNTNKKVQIEKPIETVNKNIQEKQKKLLEKIDYEANAYKKE
jgi:predicted transcriptional regulator